MKQKVRSCLEILLYKREKKARRKKYPKILFWGAILILVYFFKEVENIKKIQRWYKVPMVK